MANQIFNDPIQLPADPTTALQAATKQYVDSGLASKQATLGYTPVQQGTGVGQLGNVVKMGWDGTNTKITIDATDQGAIAMEGWVSGNYAILTTPTFTGAVTVDGNFTGTSWNMVPQYYYSDANVMVGTTSSAFLNTAANTPNNDWCTIFQCGGFTSGDRSFQVGMSWNYSGSLQYRNELGNSNWTAWRQLWDNSNFTPGNYALLSGASFGGSITATGTIFANNAEAVFTTWPDATGTIAATPGANIGLVSHANNNGTSAATSCAAMTFIRDGAFGCFLGIDTDNGFKIGGWSFGANSYHILHEGLATWSGVTAITTSSDITALDCIATSDGTLKENLNAVSLERAKRFVEQVSPCEFDWIASGKRDLGFIAQDVQKVEPLLVHENNGTLGLGYQKISVFHQVLLQEHEREINELKSVVRMLMDKVSALEASR